MALIGMAVFSTHENQKDECLHKTLASLAETVDWKRHRLILSVNNSTEKTHDLIRYYRWIIEDVIYNTHNIGTARAINKAWVRRAPGEHCIKMDDDVVIHDKNWADLMEEAIARDPLIGQIGLKRRDCWEKPQHDNPDFRSELIALPQIPGERWITVEKVKHVIGTCVMHSAALIDKAGALFQFGQYGYDDVIYSHKCYIAGFYSCFLPHINIEHIDPGDTPYQDWKHKHSGAHTQKVIDLVHDMRRGKTPIYHPFE